MAKAFFTAWALWEKLTFVLACAIVVTVFLGLCRLWYTDRQLRRYAAIEEITPRTNPTREKSIIRSLSKRRKGQPRRKASVHHNSEVNPLFGIQALEHDIEVEGVWDSRPNSRRSSLAPGPRSNTDLGLLEAQLVDDSDGSGPTSPIRQIDKIVSNHHLSSEPATKAPNQTRGRYPPHSFQRFEGSHGHKTVNTFGNRGTGSRTYQPSRLIPCPLRNYLLTAADANRSSSNASDSSRSSNENTSATLRGSAPSLLPSDSPTAYMDGESRARSNSADSITAMQYRRSSQVAEVGQLLPRADLTPPSSARSSLDRRRRRRSLDITNALGLKRNSSGKATRDVSVERTPNIRDLLIPVSTTTPDTPRDADAEYMLQHRTSNASTTHPRPASAQTVKLPTPPSPSSKESNFKGPNAHHGSQILRQVNDGFAVLRPGSLVIQPEPVAATGSSDDERRWSRQSSDRKRLQKRRPSADSQTGRSGSVDGSGSRSRRGSRSSKRSFEVRRVVKGTGMSVE